MSTELHQTEGTCTCLECAVNRDFDLPDAVLDACESGELVVFAGAGVSTESPVVIGYTLYTQLREELDDDLADQPDFPAVMSAYEAAHGRAALLARIKKHLDYVRSFPNIDGAAGRFHTELASLYTVTEIVTTNWDDYFERNCGAQPFVTEADWAFWKSSDRKVFKLHGSISNPGSIVATDGDYKRCYRNLNQGLIGAQLKMMLATKTIVFIGYSLRDSDFTALYRLMQRRMGDLLPRAYFVTPDDGEAPGLAKDMHVLRTSGVQFIRTLKTNFSPDELIPDSRFAITPLIRELVREVHHKTLASGEMRNDPAMYICACYQDGLIDAFDHQMANARKGPYHHRCHVERLIHEVYAHLREERRSQGRWETAAYIEGYMNGLYYLLVEDDDRDNLPMHYLHEDHDDLLSFDAYKEAARSLENDRPDIYAFAEKRAAVLAPGVVFQHRPSL
jgi:NAD-dependent SIR2 family protein deacetylase